jgi:hypothetical protein
MKYIDADKLNAEIDRLYNGEAPKHDQQCNFDDGYFTGIDTISQLIDSLQQEQPELPNIERAEYYYHKGVYEGLSQGRADALKILEEFMKRKADPVIVIKQQEQPEVDLEKEVEEHAIFMPHGEFASDNEIQEDMEWAKKEFRHFYERGFNARKAE